MPLLGGVRPNPAGVFPLLSIILALLVFLSRPVLAQQACAAPPSGVIAWWPFDETTGMTAKDIVGEHDGILVNNPVRTTGRVGNSLQFDGSSQYVGAADSDDWAFGTNDFTIEFWANWSAPGGGDIFHAGDVFIGNNDGPGQQNKWFFALGAGLLHFTVYNTANAPPNFFLVRAPFSPVVGQWYHLAVTKRGTLFTIYLNGAPQGAEVSEPPIANANAPLTIGQANEPFGGFMNGSLDEITVYNRALSEEELRSIANAGSAGKCRSLNLSTKSVPAMQLGQPYSFNLRATFGKEPLSWSLAGGTLPVGIILSQQGTLGGTPSDGGTFTFTARVADANSTAAQKQFTVNVLLRLPPPEIRFNKTGTLPVPGRIVDYFINVENAGTVAASEVEVLELLMPSSMFANATAFPAPNTTSRESILWILPRLNPGEAQIVTYSAKLSPAVALGTQVPGAVTAGRRNSKEPSVREVAENLRNLSCVDSACASLAVQCTQLYCDLGLPWSQCVACVTIIDECLKNCPKPCEIFPKNPFDVACREAAGPVDPNEKLSVAGRFIQPDQTLVYPIHFENIGTVEARDVFITDVLNDPNLDLSTLKILSSHGSFDLSTKTVRWDLLNRNLPPGATGNVLLSVRPKAGLPSGTTIRNKATIQFEIFAPLTTPEVVNIIDSTRPSCRVNALPAQISTPQFAVSWLGTDAVGEIDNYTVLYAVNGGAFTPLLERTKMTTTTFTGTAGRTYGFLCVAKDTAGNIEVQASVAEATTQVAGDTTSPVILPSVSGTIGTNGWYRSNVVVTWSVTDPESGIIASSGCSPTTLTNATSGTTLTCSAINGVGLARSVPVTVRIDKSVPFVSGMPPGDCMLWPPNHKLVQVATVTASDIISGLVSFNVTASSNESSDSKAPDVVITGAGLGTRIVKLVAERQGVGAGRIYTVVATASDLAGNTTTAKSFCIVPHDRK